MVKKNVPPELVGSCETTIRYWDCDCKKNFIHRKTIGNFCPKCGTFDRDQPDSRMCEVLGLYDVVKDGSVKKRYPKGA